MNSYLPTILTLIRLILSPTLIPFLCVNLLSEEYFVFNLVIAACFAIISLTDFFDGYFARKFKAKSEVGAILDHVADKFLIYSTVVSLVNIDRFYYYWAIIFIGREFYVMTLRQIALTEGFDIKVSYLGKIKTVVQMMCLGWIILNPYYNHNFELGYYFNIIEQYLIYLALFFTIISAILYTVVFIKSYKRKI